MSLSVTLLGTGNPIPSLQRSGPSQVVWADGRPFLVDCGLGTTHQLLRAGIELSDVQDLLFTHHHSDHTVEYPGFALSSWPQRRTALRVWGPGGIARVTNALFGDVHALDIEYRGGMKADRDAMPPSVTEIPDAGGVLLEVGSLRVSATPVRHWPRMVCFGFRFDLAGASVVLSGDTAYSEQLVALARGANLLVHNCSLSVPPGQKPPMWTDEAWLALSARLADHVSTPRAAGRCAADAGVRTLVLTHLQPGADVGWVLDQAALEFSGPVVVGEDLMQVNASPAACAAGVR